MKVQRAVLSVSAVLALGGLVNGAALAAGCNGVVDQFKWGCAAWDNNNGPQFPHYKPPQQKKPVAAKPAPPAPKVIPPVTGIASQKPSGMVAAGGGNLHSQNKGGMVAAGGGNLQNQNKSGMVAAGGGNLQNRNASGMVAAGGGNLQNK